MGGQIRIAADCDIIFFHIHVDVLLFTAHVVRHRRFFLQLNEIFLAVYQLVRKKLQK